MEQKPSIQIFDTEQQLVTGAANFIVDRAREAIARHGKFFISLSGGHTPEHLYTLLATGDYQNKIDWSKTFIFWGDERCLPVTDAQNNSNMTQRTLLGHISIPPKNVFPVPTELPPAEAATKYEEQIKQAFGNEPPRFDLVLLGLGENGHTASLFPHTAVVQEHSRLVKEVYVDEVKMYRITMTAPLINQALNVAFLVEGTGKADVVNTIFTTDYNPDTYPAQLIKPTAGKLYWLMDRAAAGKLNKEIIK